MSNLTSNSQTVTLAANTQQTLTWPQFFEVIVVENGANLPVFVTTDGTTAATVGGAGTDVVPAGKVAVFANRTLKPVPSKSAPGATWVSVIIGTGGSGPVTVAPQ
jgi:hypothetical protein